MLFWQSCFAAMHRRSLALPAHYGQTCNVWWLATLAIELPDEEGEQIQVDSLSSLSVDLASYWQIFESLLLKWLSCKCGLVQNIAQDIATQRPIFHATVELMLQFVAACKDNAAQATSAFALAVATYQDQADDYARTIEEKMPMAPGPATSALAWVPDRIKDMKDKATELAQYFRRNASALYRDLFLDFLAQLSAATRRCEFDTASTEDCLWGASGKQALQEHEQNTTGPACSKLRSGLGRICRTQRVCGWPTMRRWPCASGCGRTRPLSPAFSRCWRSDLLQASRLSLSYPGQAAWLQRVAFMCMQHAACSVPCSMHALAVCPRRYM